MPYLKILFRLLPLFLLLSACGGSLAADSVTVTANLAGAPLVQPFSPEALPANSAGVKLVAKVNGQEITLPEFERSLTRRQLELIDASDAYALRAEVLDQLIEQTLIEQGAAAQQIAVSDQEVQTELESYVVEAGSEAAWQQWLATNQYQPDEFAATLRLNLLTIRVRDSLTADLAVNVAQVHARHILVRTHDEANAALARIQAGEDFAAVAASLSRDDTTREQGGDLGWFTIDELLVPQLAQTAFALEPGAVGGPVGTVLGYHVIQTLEFADRPVDPERRVFIAQSRFENWLRPLLENATIERYM